MPSPQILDMLRAKAAASQPGQGAPGATQPDPNAAPSPTAAPMSTPENKEGEDMHAKVNARIALDLLQQTLAKMSPGSAMGEKLKSIIVSLASAIGLSDMDKSSSLVPAQIKMMMAQLPQTGNMTQGQKSAMANPPQGLGQPPGMQAPQPPQPQ